MPTISHLFDSALTEEPDYRLDVQGVLTAARRSRRNRRVAVLGSGAALTVGVGGLALTLAASGSAPHRDTAGVQAGSSGLAAASASAQVPTSAGSRAPSGTTSGGTDVHGITRHNLAALVEQDAGVRLSGVTVEDLPPTGDIDLSAGVASARGQYLNVQVTPSGFSSATAPTCADISGDAPDGDGYTGPCSVTTMPGGGWLVVRAGRTSDDRFAITQAELVAADGSSISAEASNQLSSAKHGIAPAVTRNPPLSSAQLRALVQALDSHR